MVASSTLKSVRDRPMEAHAPSSGMVLSPAASIPPTRKKSRRARPAPGASSRMRFPQGPEVVLRGPDNIHSANRRHPQVPGGLNLSGAVERIRHPVYTLSTRASDPRATSPREIGEAGTAGLLAFPVH